MASFDEIAGGGDSSLPFPPFMPLPVPGSMTFTLEYCSPYTEGSESEDSESDRPMTIKKTTPITSPKKKMTPPTSPKKGASPLKMSNPGNLREAASKGYVKISETKEDGSKKRERPLTERQLVRFFL